MGFEPGKRGIHVFRTFIRLLNITPEYNGRRSPIEGKTGFVNRSLGLEP